MSNDGMFHIKIDIEQRNDGKFERVAYRGFSIPYHNISALGIIFNILDCALDECYHEIVENKDDIE